jgi:hypothetical protein
MKRILWSLFLSLAAVPWVWADPSMPVSLARPRFLTLLDKLPMHSAVVPEAPVKDTHGQTITAKGALLPPPAATMDFFSDPSLFLTIKKNKKSERDFRYFYWHGSIGPDYCHYRSLEGDHWYGWVEQGYFYYVLWKGNRFWWRDPIADHWLYYARGVWWRSDGQDQKTLQACVEGEYYLCDKSGKVLKDMGPDGNGLILSPGNITYRADVWRQKRAERRAKGEGNEGGRDRSSSREASGGAAQPVPLEADSKKP